MILFFLLSNLAFADDEAFEDIDKIATDRIEYNIEDVAPKGIESGKILELQTVMKAKGNVFINDDYSSVKSPEESLAEDNTTANDANRAVEDFDMFGFKIENRFKFHLYDDIRFEIPFSLTYDSFYDKKAVDKLGEYGLKLSRVSFVELGLWFDWYAVDFFKLGLRGGRDSHTGNLFLIKNKLYKGSDGIQEHGFDLVDFNFMLFSEFLVGNSWVKFEPEVQFCLEGGYPVVASRKYDDVIFTIKILTPLKFNFKFLEDLKLAIKIDAGADKAFTGDSNSAESKYGADAGYGFYAKTAVELEYKVLDMLKFRLPLLIKWKGRYWHEDSFSNTPSISFKTDPNIDFNLKLFDNLYLLADVALDYEFMKMKFADEFQFSTPLKPTFRWGAGFRYDSIY